MTWRLTAGKAFLIAGLVATLPALAGDDDKRRVRLGGVVVGASYNSGPGWYGPGAFGPAWYGMGMYRPWWGMYDPFWSSPFLHSGLYRGFGYAPNMGEIKLDAPKGSAVYLDGAFAGSAEKLKSMWLEPGIYELHVAGGSGAEEFRKKLYVLSGKTLRIRAGSGKS